MMKTVSVNTESHTEFIDITIKVKSVVSDSGVKEGMAVVYVPHTTAGVTINESADPSVKADTINSLEKNVPWSDNYKHSEGNAAAHIKASLMGSSVNIMIQDGDLVLGTWQGIFFCEFDGSRSRKVIVKVIESS
ncbi:MAG: YjbQ family protein [candidate division Zixibacteria bacterium]|nr:YjbQ family protein [candidate division Zixibacteria bacterium]NIR67920.1 YjbQ family protein [candidate division Zixibacteria bacterium]NIS16283.1 YjbQ family protein [candidate division Zixibacteria bacterium]NIS49137.1 YjbQ family protein [candidate division Zixibacteria bacterium]NIT53645.1 YjbQ family protein [candidate division Zixibacteria bacterium]